MKLSWRTMNLKACDQVQFFKGAQARLYTMGTACLIWKRREAQGKSLDMLELK